MTTYTIRMKIYTVVPNLNADTIISPQNINILTAFTEVGFSIFISGYCTKISCTFIIKVIYYAKNLFLIYF